MPGAKIGTYDDLVEMTPGHLRPVTRALKELVLSIDPAAHVVVRLGDRAATFGVGPRKMREGYCYVLPHAKWVNLGFYKGADIPDPGNLLEGTGAKMRHVKIRRPAECDDPRLARLIRDAVDERNLATRRQEKAP